jgi:hypothetical protein
MMVHEEMLESSRAYDNESSMTLVIAMSVVIWPATKHNVACHIVRDET